ncbi:MAG: hypothetical protein WBL49_09855 [Nitrososphaeraceae archaeon]|jgi:hypothetical protein
MSLEEETTRLEFVSKTADQTYVVDSIIIQLTTRGYDNNSKTRNASNRGNTMVILSINNEREFNEQDKQLILPYRQLKLNFQYHYATPYENYKDWVYDLTLNVSNQERKAQQLEPDFFRVTQDGLWVTVEWLSYTRKETFGGASTSDSPDCLINSLNIPINNILNLQAIKKS